MSNKKIIVEDLNSTSQYDGPQVLKEVHSLPGKYLRTRDSLTLVKEYFDNFTVSYDNSKRPVDISYFVGTEPHLTTIGVVSSADISIAGSGFVVSSGRREKRYAVYYTVSGNGTAPSIAGTTNVEVPLELGDSSKIIAIATKMALDSIDAFDTRVNNSVIEIETKKLGETNNTILFNGSPFLITNDPGIDELLSTIYINYSENGNPIWQGQELIDYSYDVFSAKFVLFNGSYSEVYDKKTLNVLNASEVIWDEIVTTFPDTVTDLYTYSFQGTAVQTVRVTYTNASKSQIIVVTKERL